MPSNGILNPFSALHGKHVHRQKPYNFSKGTCNTLAVQQKSAGATVASQQRSTHCERKRLLPNFGPLLRNSRNKQQHKHTGKHPTMKRLVSVLMAAPGRKTNVCLGR